VKINRTGEPGYAGMTTFEKVPLVLDPQKLSGADVAILGAPMDDAVTHRPGARFGPRAIRSAIEGGGEPGGWDMDLGIDLFAELTVVDHGDAAVIPADAVRSHAAIYEAVRGIVAAGAIPIVLGGDHSIAYPDIKAVAEAHPPGDVAVVQFDTHADTASEIWGVKHSHGSPFRHLITDGILPGNRLVQVGLRGRWPYPAEFSWMRAAGVRWYRMEQVIERGIDAVVEAVLRDVAGASHLFLSVDVDVLDPAFAPGTGTPQPGGMSTRELLRAVRSLAARRGLIGMDVVEVCPPYDHADVTALAARQVVLDALSGLALHRSGREARPEDPA